MNRTQTLLTSMTTLSVLGAGLAGFGLKSEAFIPTATTTATTATTAIMPNTNGSLATTTYSVDPVHSNVLFKIRHSGVSNFYGRFNKVQGSIEFDKNDISASSMTFTIPVSSVDTNHSDRDDHIKNAEFFNARQYKEISFESTSIEEVSDGVYTLKGNLSLHGETKEITAELIEVRTGESRGKPLLGFEARFSIKRSDYGITKYLADDMSDNGGLGNTVEIIVAVEAGAE